MTPRDGLSAGPFLPGVEVTGTAMPVARPAVSWPLSWLPADDRRVWRPQPYPVREVPSLVDPWPETPWGLAS